MEALDMSSDVDGLFRVAIMQLKVQTGLIEGINIAPHQGSDL